jgi:pimeloyl-ACP methyl ester carboxylesterase
MNRQVKEGYIPFEGYRTWYRIVGDAERPGKLPLLCLPGGPGACHDYLEGLDPMADTGRRVIYYDQLGCGNSHIGERERCSRNRRGSPAWRSPIHPPA